jgi:hypothetical protein
VKHSIEWNRSLEKLYSQTSAGHTGVEENLCKKNRKKYFDLLLPNELTGMTLLHYACYLPSLTLILELLYETSYVLQIDNSLHLPSYYIPLSHVTSKKCILIKELELIQRRFSFPTHNASSPMNPTDYDIIDNDPSIPFRMAMAMNSSNRPKMIKGFSKNNKNEAFVIPMSNSFVNPLHSLPGDESERPSAALVENEDWELDEGTEQRQKRNTQGEQAKKNRLSLVDNKTTRDQMKSLGSSPDRQIVNNLRSNSFQRMGSMHKLGQWDDNLATGDQRGTLKRKGSFCKKDGQIVLLRATASPISLSRDSNRSSAAISTDIARERTNAVVKDVDCILLRHLKP